MNKYIVTYDNKNEEEVIEIIEAENMKNIIKANKELDFYSIKNINNLSSGDIIFRRKL